MLLKLAGKIDESRSHPAAMLFLHETTQASLFQERARPRRGLTVARHSKPVTGSRIVYLGTYDLPPSHRAPNAVTSIQLVPSLEDATTLKPLPAPSKFVNPCRTHWMAVRNQHTDTTHGRSSTCPCLIKPHAFPLHALAVANGLTQDAPHIT
jgi:hypothetical protein